MPTLGKVRAAQRRWLMSPDNTPEEEEAYRELYELLFPRPRGSHNATKEEESPVMLP